MRTGAFDNLETPAANAMDATYLAARPSGGWDAIEAVQESEKAPPPEPMVPTPKNPTLESYDQAVPSRTGAAVMVPRDVAVGFLKNKTVSGDIVGLADGPLNAAYRMASLAEQQGYSVQFTSGKRPGSKGYHGYGEAVDVRIRRKGKDGKLEELPTAEEINVGKQLGKEAGWASMLDEIQHRTPDWSGEHLHFSFGQERNLLGSKMHHELNSRHWTDQGYEDLARGKTPLPGSAPPVGAGGAAPAAGGGASAAGSAASAEQPVFTSGGGSGAPADLSGLPTDEQIRVRDMWKSSKELQKDNAGLPSMIETIAHSNGIDPAFFARLIQAESNFNHKAVSPAGARGLGQIMPGTLKGLAAETGINIDNYDNDKGLQLKMSALYLKKMLDKFGGSYARAAAAYNAGPGGAEGFIQGKNIYNETSNYVYKILNNYDPTLAPSRADTDNMIRTGTGPSLNAIQQQDRTKSMLQNTQTKSYDFLSWMFGGKDDPYSAQNTLFDESNPVNAYHQGSMIFKEVLQDFTMGASNPILGLLGQGKFVEDAEATQKARDELLYGVPGLEGTAMRGVSLLGTGGPRLAAAIMSGSFLLKGLRAIPGLKWLGDGMSVLNAEEKASVAAMQLAEQQGGVGVLQQVKNLFTVGPMKLAGAHAMEAGVVGGVQMGNMAASEYLWNIQKNGEKFDLGEMVSHWLTGASQGATVGLGLSFALPQAFGITGNMLMRLMGSEARPGIIGSMANTLGKMGFMQRTAANTMMGGIGGGLLGAAANVTGVDEALTGEQIPFTDSAMAMAGIGAAGTVAGEFGGLNWTNIGKFLNKSPMFTNILAQTRTKVGELGDEFVRVFGSEVYKGQEEFNRIRRATQVQTMSDLHLNNLTQGMEHNQQLMDAADKQISSLQEKVAGAQQHLMQQKTLLSQIENSKDPSHPLGIPNAFADIKGDSEKYQALQMKRSATQQKMSTADPTTAKTLEIEMRGVDAEINKIDEKYKNLQVPNAETTWNTYKKVSTDVARMEAVANQMAQPIQDHMQALQENKNVLGMRNETWKAHAEYVKTRREQLMASGGEWGDMAPELKLFSDYDRTDPNYNQQVMDAVSRVWNSVEGARLKESLMRYDTFDKFQARMATGVTQDATRLKLKDVSPWEKAQTNLGSMDKRYAELRKMVDDPSVGENAVESGGGAYNSHVKESSIPWGHDDTSTNPFNLSTKVKGDTAMVGDAETILRQALDSGMDASAISSKASEMAEHILLNPDKIATPRWDGTASADMAALAMTAMRFGDNKLPFFTEKAVDVKKSLGETRAAQIKKQADAFYKDLKEYETYANLNLKDRVVGDYSYTDTEGNAHTIDGSDSMYAAGGNISAISSPKEMLKNISKTYRGLLKSLQKEPTLPTTLSQPIDALIKGGVEYGNQDAVKAVFLSHGSDAGNIGRHLQEYETALRIAETRRLGWFAQNQQMRANPTADFNNVAVGAMRTKLIMDIPDSVSIQTKTALEHLFSDDYQDAVLNSDSFHVETWNRAIADLVKKGPIGPQDIFGLTQRAFQDLGIQRPLAMAHVREQIIRPAFAREIEALKSNSALLKTEDGMKKFNIDLTHAIENPQEMRDFRSKWGEKADPIIDLVLKINSIVEKVRENDPRLFELAKGAKWQHQFTYGAAHLNAIKDTQIRGLQMQYFNEKLVKLGNDSPATLRLIEKMVKDSEDTLKARGIDWHDYMKMDPETRAKALFLSDGSNGPHPSTGDWEALSESDKKAKGKDAQDIATNLMFRDPVTDPVMRASAQLESLASADGLRRILHGLSMVKAADVAGATLGEYQPLVRVAGKEKHASGLMDMGTGEIPKPYQSLSSVPRFSNSWISLPDGNSYRADDIFIHPKIHDWMGNYLSSQHPKFWEGEKIQQWRQFASLTRQNLLMGSIIPHFKNMVQSMGGDMLNSPWKMANLSSAGAKIISKDVSPEALKINNIRAGLNVRTLERNMFQMSDTLLKNFGPYAEKIYGIGDSGISRFMASIDHFNPNREAARASMGKAGRFFSDLLGVPNQIDVAMNEAGLFQMIEDGQHAGHMYRVADLMKNNADLAKIEDPALRLKAAQQIAANTSNQLAGAMSTAFVSDPYRQLLFEVGLTPTWFMSKAALLVDSLDALTYMAGKPMGAKRGLIEAAFNRQPFAQYPPEVRDLVRSRTVKMATGMLVGSFMATQAAQFMINGNFTWNHPPDKMFHIYHDGNYYNSFFSYGFVKNFLSFASDSLRDQPSVSSLVKGEAEFTKEDVPKNMWRALSRQLSDQLVLDLPEVASKIEEAQSKQKGVPFSHQVANYVDSSARALPIYEVLGMNDKAKLTEMLGMRGDLSEGDKAARMLNPGQYLGRQAGVFESRANPDRNIRGELSGRMKDITTEAKQRVEFHMEKARLADSLSERQKWLSEAAKSWAAGVEIKDKEIKKMYPGGVFRLDGKVFDSMINETFAPAATALAGAQKAIIPELVQRMGQHDMGE